MTQRPALWIGVATVFAVTGSALYLSGCTSSGSGASTAAATSTPAAAGTPSPKYNQDFENPGDPNLGWSTGMSQVAGNLPNSWILSDQLAPSPNPPVPPAPVSHSGAYRFGTENNTPNHGRYYKPEDSWIMSPSWILPTEPVKMTFWHWFEFVTGADGVLIEGRLFDPSSWAPTSGWFPLGPVLPCSGPMNAATPAAPAPTPWLRGGVFAYTGSCGAWQKVTIPLDSFAGQLLRVRWHLGAMSGGGVPTKPGYYLDDVVIE